MKSQIEIKVRGYHLDAFGHVNNARYLEFLEEARWDYLEKSSSLTNFLKDDITFIIANININYRKPVLMGQKIFITTFLSKMGRRSGVIRQEVKLADKEIICADADITFVLINRKTGDNLVFEDELKTVMENLLVE